MLKCTLRITVLLLACIVAALAKPVWAQAASDAEVKVAFLLNFARFTSWPESVDFTNGLIICAVGESPLGGYLQALNGREVQGHRITVNKIDSLAIGSNDCHIVFIAEEQKAELGLIQNWQNGTAVLTVSDIVQDVAGSNVMILMKQRGGRIRFDVNLVRVREVGLKLNAQLLELADKVSQ
jgi:hypothetical protein